MIELEYIPEPKLRRVQQNIGVRRVRGGNKVLSYEFGKGTIEIKHTINGRFAKTTTRDATPYLDTLAGLRKALDSDQLDVVEIGAGLSQMPHYLIEMGHRVTVIDPFDYEGILPFFKKIRPHLEKGHESLIDTLIERRKRVLIDERITLLNKTLGNALKDEPNLEESFDLVIDFNGAIYWHRSEDVDQDAIIAMEKRLSKPGGKHFFNR